jgi:hypothetical protein
MVYWIAKVTQIISVYEFGELSFFLIELNFFIVYFFTYILKK